MLQWLLMGFGIVAALFIVGGLLKLITEPSAEALFSFGFGVLGLVVTVTIALSSTEAADSNGLTSTPGQHFTATPVETPLVTNTPSSVETPLSTSRPPSATVTSVLIPTATTSPTEVSPTTTVVPEIRCRDGSVVAVYADCFPTPAGGE